jgi:hypothetical protein
MYLHGVGRCAVRCATAKPRVHIACLEIAGALVRRKPDEAALCTGHGAREEVFLGNWPFSEERLPNRFPAGYALLPSL